MLIKSSNPSIYSGNNSTSAESISRESQTRRSDHIVNTATSAVMTNVANVANSRQNMQPSCDREIFNESLEFLKSIPIQPYYSVVDQQSDSVSDHFPVVQINKFMSNQQSTAFNILSNIDGFSDQGACDLLNEYHFPESGVYTAETFASEILQSHKIPNWADCYRKHRQQLCTPTSSGQVKHQEIDPATIPSRLGCLLGEGGFGHVFLDAEDDSYVIKRFHADDCGRSDISALEEAIMFKRYYGEGAVSFFIDSQGIAYSRMYRVPGVELDEIIADTLPDDAEQRLVDMLERMNQLGIMHNDLHCGNILWDAQSQTFFPIDINNIRDDYFAADRYVKKRLNTIHDKNWQTILTILKNSKR